MCSVPAVCASNRGCRSTNNASIIVRARHGAEARNTGGRGVVREGSKWARWRCNRVAAHTHACRARARARARSSTGNCSTYSTGDGVPPFAPQLANAILTRRRSRRSGQESCALHICACRGEAGMATHLLSNGPRNTACHGMRLVPAPLLPTAGVGGGRALASLAVPAAHTVAHCNPLIVPPPVSTTLLPAPPEPRAERRARIGSARLDPRHFALLPMLQLDSHPAGDSPFNVFQQLPGFSL